jgi:N-acetylglucosamine-6-phosphate deacetylase
MPLSLILSACVPESRLLFLGGPVSVSPGAAVIAAAGTVRGSIVKVNSAVYELGVEFTFSNENKKRRNHIFPVSAVNNF